MKRQSKKLLLFFVLLFLAFIVNSCGTWGENSSQAADSAYLPLDDSEYPYAGLPRLVIETENFRQINNKETKVPARLQFYGKNKPSSEILDLTIKGRGNSSFVMTKYGYKIKLAEKDSLLGMPKDKEWDLISNFRDRSLLRNYITYQLAGILGDEYFPKCEFIELYLNRQYLGIYLLVEHVKVSKNRVDIPKSDSSFLFEKTSATTTDGALFTSSLGYIFKFRQPKEPSEESKELLENHIVHLRTCFGKLSTRHAKVENARSLILEFDGHVVVERGVNTDKGREVLVDADSRNVEETVWHIAACRGVLYEAKSAATHAFNPRAV